MNRRELLKSLAAIVPIIPMTVRERTPEGEMSVAKEYPIEEGPYYLFVVNGQTCDLDAFVGSFYNGKVRGGIVVCPNGDLDNFCRIYKLEE